ncbi:MAG: NAD-binding protein, partial [Candidatus Kariarchaeaceae archaeon]
MSQRLEKLPLRVKVLGMLVSTVFLLSILAFRYLEDLSWLDSLYFLIVTVSTVGFGDIEPEHGLTKIVLMMLIITGISTIALLSEFAIDTMIKIRLAPNLDLPVNLPEMKGHIVIGGYTSVSETIASLAQDRYFDLIIIDNSGERVRAARDDGFTAYHGSIERPVVLEKLYLKNSKALYLFLGDDQATIQTSILARRISPEIFIFTDTVNPINIEFGELIGITRTYHRERMIASFIRIIFKDYPFIKIPNQDVDDSLFHLLLVSTEYSHQKNIPEYFILGEINSNLTSLQFIEHEGEIDDPEGRLMLAIPRTKVNAGIDFSPIAIENKYDKIVIGGFSSYVHHVLRHLEIPIEKFLIITLDESENDRAQNGGFRSIHTNQRDLPAIIEEHLQNTDLVVNIFDNIIDSLVMNSMIEMSSKD